jgi:predicted dehydrogenase
MVTRFAVVGAGWRAKYFLNAARHLPEEFEVTGVVARRPAILGVPVHPDLAALLREPRPDFVVSAVSWDANPDVLRRVVEAGLPVLSETPPAPDAAGLRELWADVGDTGLVQVAEQYPLVPSHAARLEVVRLGAIGTPTSVQISSTHGYHAVALIRRFLGVVPGSGLTDAGFGPVTVTARQFRAPLIDPIDRDGWTDRPEPVEAVNTIATLDFGGQVGLYDFTDNQWHNQLRARRLSVRGSAGEIVDLDVLRLVAPRTIVRTPLVRRQTGYDLDLDGFETDHLTFGDEVVYRNPFVGHRFNDEEIAIATLLRQLGAWTRDAGPAPYPLAQAAQDHLISLAIDEAAATGADVTTAVELWAEKL